MNYEQLTIMQNKPYLIFNLNGLQYGIDASIVREIFPLPQLTPIAEAPLDFVGILNLRSKIVPVMHLDLRLGSKRVELKASDTVIVVEWHDLAIGMIVSSVDEVINIDASAIAPEIDYGRIRDINPVFVNAVAKLGAEAIVLLDADGLIRQPDEIVNLVFDTSENNAIEEIPKVVGDFYELYCPNATVSEKAIFHKRADNLRAAIAEDIDISQQIPIAVIELGKEYFGIELEAVREFTTLRNLTRIPCSPSHIVGNTNLRGEILTVVDIRSLLNLTNASVKTGTKAVVVDVEGIIAALPVDEIFDVMYLKSSDLNLVPTAVSGNSNEYLRGTVFDREKILGILNMSAILTRNELAVNEET